MATVELVPGIDLLQSMRSVGYSFEAAVADILDNSISAGATKIDVLVDVAEGRFVSIRDNGRGMSIDAAMEALRLAGTARSGTENTQSLGRFGLGLKTASLSQGRRVDVISRHEGKLIGLAWDIDMVRREQKWVVDVLSDSHIADLPGAHQPALNANGTVVLWSKLDYLLGNAADPSEHLAHKVGALRTHLGLVFHRYIQSTPGIEISLNRVTVEPIDPFLESHPKTQKTPTQVIRIEGSPVELQGFTLPHQRNIPERLKRRHDLGDGLRDGQGFYVYRNKRLISQGGWFGLRRKEELTKQARVRVDIGDGLDSLWQIDIRKSRSEPPPQFKNAIRPLLGRLVLRSEKVHKYRGRRITADKYANYWQKTETRDGIKFLINESHPLVERIADHVEGSYRRLFRQLLEDLADNFPYYDTYIATAQDQMFESGTPSIEKIRLRLEALREAGYAKEEVSEVVREAEPFSAVANIDDLVEKVWRDASE